VQQGSDTLLERCLHHPARFKINMGIVRKSDTLERLRKDSGMQTSEVVPTKMVDSVQPVLVVNPRPRLSIVRGDNNASGSTINLYQTPSEARDFYLVSASVSYEKSALSDNPDVSLRITVDGAVRKVVSINTVAAISSNASLPMYFGEVGIKLDRGTFIQLVGTNTVGVLNKSASIVGYELDAE